MSCDHESTGVDYWRKSSATAGTEEPPVPELNVLLYHFSMFECRVCIRRYLRAIIDDSALLLQTQRQAPALLNAACSRFRSTLQRPYSTAVTGVSRLRSKSPSRPQASKQASSTEVYGESRLRKQLQAELKYLKDPLRLGDRVQTLIKDKYVDRAFDLVRLASKDVECTVSWNHLVHYQMAQGKVNAALKTYNEMKKRAQIPDSFTYTILLRGLAQHIRYPQSLGKALAIYHSMFAPNSLVKPTIIHTNAVLTVCSRGKDMDSIWGIAAKLPEAGRAAPDNLTWTIILNAIRENATRHVTHESEGVSHQRWQQAVMEGRKMWDNIVLRWRKGDLRIDESLVCAMGRLLLIGQRRNDWYDVLSLVEQTTGIPNPVPVLLESKPKEYPRLHGLREPTITAKNGFCKPELRAGGEFAAVKSDNVAGKHSPLSYAQPGCNMLSMVIDACLKLRSEPAARVYWKLLTGPEYKVKPDSDSCTRYLKILRALRASREALQLVQHTMPNSRTQPTHAHYFIAMYACRRDKHNRESFNHASQLIQLMRNQETQLSVIAMVIYLEIASWTGDNAKIVEALQNLGADIVKLKDLFTEAPASNMHEEKVILLARRMIGCYDQLQAEGGQNETYAAAKAKLSAYVTKWAHILPKGRVPKTERSVLEREEYRSEGVLKREERRKGSYEER